MLRLQLGLRDLFWMILAVGLCIAWLGDRYEAEQMKAQLGEHQYWVRMTGARKKPGAESTLARRIRTLRVSGGKTKIACFTPFYQR